LSADSLRLLDQEQRAPSKPKKIFLIIITPRKHLYNLNWSSPTLFPFFFWVLTKAWLSIKVARDDVVVVVVVVVCGRYLITSEARFPGFCFESCTSTTWIVVVVVVVVVVVWVQEFVFCCSSLTFFVQLSTFWCEENMMATLGFFLPNFRFTTLF
jgi:hypothetical protein